jgi:molybdopterin converting factor subunit 1
VSVLYFAALRDLAGVGEETVAIGERLHVRELLQELESKRPALGGRLLSQAVRVAVNEEFVDASVMLADGDVVALIPPVSGG